MCRERGLLNVKTDYHPFDSGRLVGRLKSTIPFYNSEYPDCVQTKHQLPHASQWKHAGEEPPPLTIVAENPACGEKRALEPSLHSRRESRVSQP